MSEADNNIHKFFELYEPIREAAFTGLDKWVELHVAMYFGIDIDTLSDQERQLCHVVAARGVITSLELIFKELSEGRVDFDVTRCRNRGPSSIPSNICVRRIDHEGHHNNGCHSWI